MAGHLSGESSYHGTSDGGSSRNSQDRQEESGRWSMSRKGIEENSPSRRDGIDLKRETYFRKDCYHTLYLILSVAAIILSTALVATHLIKPSSSNPLLHSYICDQAHGQAGCISMVSEVVKDSKTIMLQMFLEESASAIQKAMDTAKNVNQRINNNPREQAALLDCVELMDLSMDRVFDSKVALQHMTTSSIEDAHTWLSSVLTNHVTCLDGLEGSAWTTMEPGLKDLISTASTSLAMLVAVSPLKTKVMIDEPLNGELPTWVTGRDRTLLQALPKKIEFNVTVAKDRTGNYSTVKDAVASAPTNSKSRFVIYVKKGKYEEHVVVGKNKKNLKIVGDGMNSTIITGSLHKDNNTTTLNSATVAVVGDGFMAQDICFQNTAGPENNQSVALLVMADKSVINRCCIDSYQDTLYAHSHRQFFRDSYITGTVDFIFGNAAVVFQNCTLVARKPRSGQTNMVTAQGRTDLLQQTGTSIQNCKIIASEDLEPKKGLFRSYLGRPWKNYSRTVVMQSCIGDHIDPAGWSEWGNDSAPKTLYYGEYNNKGPGAGISKRVNWSGYHVIKRAEEAKNFTVAELINGGTWLNFTGVAYTEGLF